MSDTPSETKVTIFTLSNGLTSLRLLAAPIFYWAIVHQLWWPACALFWLAVASDLIDGRIARARNEASAFGGALDHGSDATFVALGHLALAQSGTTPDLLAILIVAAFLQYAFDSRILSGHTLRASLIGRWNGVLYFFSPGIFVTREALGLSLPADAWIKTLGWLLLVSTLISMVDRLIGVVQAMGIDLTRR